MSPRQHSVDDNPLALDTLRGEDEIAIPSYLLMYYGLLQALKSDLPNTLSWDDRLCSRLWPFFQATFDVLSLYYRWKVYTGPNLNYRRKPSIAPRLWAVTNMTVREMDNVLVSMKRWESRPCQKMDDYKNDEDTTTRLRSFLNAMESLDLTNKIHELKGLSRDLNHVTKRLIRSRIAKATNRIATWGVSLVYYLFRGLVSDG